MLAMLALSGLLLAAPPGELMWWRPDAPASGLAIGDGGVWRGLGSGRSEWWPLDGDPPSLMARTTPCPSVLETFDPPRSRVGDLRLPWGPLVALGWSERCALASAAAGPLVRYNRGVVAGVVPRQTPARLVATDADCARGAVVDDETLRIFPLDGEGDGVTVTLPQTPTDIRLTAEAAIVADLDGALTLVRPDGTRLAAIDPGAPLRCAATDRGLVAAETVEGRTAAYAMSDGALRWGRGAVDGELGDAWTTEPPAPITAISADPTGRWVAAVVDGRVRLWQPATGRVRPLPGEALDAAFDSSGRQLAVRGPGAVTLWRLDGPAPTRARTVPVAALEGAEGPTLAWVGRRLVTLADGSIEPVLGIRGAGLPIDAPRALVARGSTLTVLAETGGARVRVGRELTLEKRVARQPGPVRGARSDCDGIPAAWHGSGWRSLAPSRDDDPPPVRLCAPTGGGVELALVRDGVLATAVMRRPGQPPIRREVRAPLLGDPHHLAIDDGGRVTALLDGRAVVRWQPGAEPARLTWVVVGGQDVIAGGGRISGARSALGSLGWWTAEGVVAAVEAPQTATPPVQPLEGGR